LKIAHFATHDMDMTNKSTHTLEKIHYLGGAPLKKRAWIAFPIITLLTINIAACFILINKNINVNVSTAQKIAAYT
jgi:hypothetical protein